MFRIAIEEGEAWLLGDKEAVRKAYPNAKDRVLTHYIQDGICGTWEVLADAVYHGGAAKLGKLGYPKIGEAKHEWAARIAPLVRVEENESHSFAVFRDGVRKLASS